MCCNAELVVLVTVVTTYRALAGLRQAEPLQSRPGIIDGQLLVWVRVTSNTEHASQGRGTY